MPDVVLTGYATVKFRKVISDADADEIAELENSFSTRAFQINEEDLTDIEDIDSCDIKIRE